MPSAAACIVVRDVEDRERLVVVEALAPATARTAGRRPLLLERVSDAEADAAEDLRRQAARVDHRADVADAEVVHQRDRARFDVHFDFGEARRRTNRCRRRADRCPSPRPSGRARPVAAADALVTAWMSAGSSWPS